MFISDDFFLKLPCPNYKGKKEQIKIFVNFSLKKICSSI